MFTIRQYVKSSSLEEAWTLNQKRANRIIGGMGWMKMSSANVATAIDLNGLQLDRIEETEEEFIIGAMVTLRQIETDASLNAFFHDAPRESLRHIVGVQFRNCATIGGTLWLRPGFSDPITLLMALDCSVELYRGHERTEEIGIEQFCQMKKDNSILTAIHLKKTRKCVAYKSFRNTETDFPVLAAAVSLEDGKYFAAVGARPFLARRVEANDVRTLVAEAQKLSYQGNVRASLDYRRMLAKVLIEDAAEELKNIG